MLALGVHLAPLLLKAERPRDAAEVALKALASDPSPEQANRLQWCVATGYLRLGRAPQALPFVQQVVAADPTHAEVVLEFAKRFPPSMAEEAFPLLGGVIRSSARGGCSAVVRAA
jgi:hypothetical protein